MQTRTNDGVEQVVLTARAEDRGCPDVLSRKVGAL
jgi:hypothetical protein